MSAATDQKRAHTAATGLQHVQCLGLHRVPTFPYPSTGPSIGSGFDQHGPGIPPCLSTSQSTRKACQGIVAGSA
jgi:hypothetical protein